MGEGSFNKMLQECVEETFNKLFGKEGARTICHLLGKKLIANMTQPKGFSETLYELLGSGASLIEKMILQKLYQELGLEYEEKEDYTFTRYIEEAKNFFMLEKRRGKNLRT